LCAAAEESWKKLEVALAETNLARRRALARSGLGSKSELRRAESEVARLRGGL
jgi:multidrug resistance efflux pump